ncbi:MAG: phenylalanine--tRNA ligase subunit beta [Pseudomonadales bacterium]|nr:phenylalanine--tRNA ligase subunit beta [Pseudomonadales bacterium]
MNILIPHKWLLEHLDTKATDAEIQKYVSLCGPSIERIYQTEGDSVYDIEITTNRVDSMSVRGIAREIAVILEQFDVKASLKPSNIIKNVDVDVSPTEMLPLPKIKNDPKLSKRLTCVVLSGVNRNQTPDWMAKRLIQTGQNVHDAVIDITNYVTHELGHPCHAFDYDKLMQTGGEINVEEAKKGETFSTLDGETFTTVGGEVVFKNGQNEIIDLPSIKGTANTSIDDSTKNVLLLLESIMAEKVRFASMTHAIRTTAAQLMEKNVDPNLAEDVLLKGIELYKSLTDAKVASKIFDEYPGKKSLDPVKITLKRINEYLGIDIKLDKVQSILEQLECKVKASDDLITVYPPTFRPDLSIPADIVEEIARIYGYHNFPSILMDTPIPTNRQKGVNFIIEDRIKRFLSSIGLQEIYSYSMVSEEIALKTDTLENHLKISNPLTDDRIYMRLSLIPSLEEIIDQNPQTPNLSVFEIANVYPPIEGNLPNENLHLGIVSTESYPKVRGIVESLFENLFIEKITIEIVSSPMVSNVGIITVIHQGKKVELGGIKLLQSNKVAVEIDFAKLLQAVSTHPNYQPSPKTAVMVEDMTFTLPPKTLVGDVINSILQLSKIITKVELKTKYKQNYSFVITYHDDDKNVSSVDVEPLRKKIPKVLDSIYKAKLVGTV